MTWDRLREDVSFKAMKEKHIQHRSSVSWRQTLSAPDSANGFVGRVHKRPVSDSPEFKNDGKVLNADETVWRRRCETRHQGIVLMKTNDLYFQAMWAAHEKNIARPRTPDPFDRSTSKREWEKNMMIWRKELHRIAQSSIGVEL